MSQFKRVRLRGSDELFRDTRADAEARAEPADGGGGPPPPGEPVVETLSVALTVEEVRDLVEALQLARFPDRQRPRPTMVQFETLGALQDRLRRLIAE